MYKQTKVSIYFCLRWIKILVIFKNYVCATYDKMLYQLLHFSQPATSFKYLKKKNTFPIENVTCRPKGRFLPYFITYVYIWNNVMRFFFVCMSLKCLRKRCYWWHIFHINPSRIAWKNKHTQHLCRMTNDIALSS